MSINAGLSYLESEKQFIRDNVELMTTEELCQKLGRDDRSVRLMIDALGFSLTGKGFGLSSAEIEVIRTHAGTLHHSEIAKMIDRPVNKVIQTARENKIKLLISGENHHKAKHSDEKVAEVKRLFDLGTLTNSEIAKHTGIPLGSVYYILRRAGRIQQRHLIKYRHWTKAEDEILLNNFMTTNKAEIIAMLPGRTYRAIALRAGEKGLFRKGRKKRIEVTTAQIKELRILLIIDDMPKSEMARKIGIHPKSIYSVIRAHCSDIV